MNTEDLVKQNLIVKAYAGSLAYGTNLPTSDVDFRGLFCANPINLLTPFYKIRESVDSTEEDTKYYELAHFMKLCLDCNPNIVELLWVDPSDVVFKHPAYDLLVKHRSEFLSSKVAFTFSGYAISQLKRLQQSKSKVTHLPDLLTLCSILEKSINNKLINNTWIENHCGSFVLSFMEEKKYNLNDSPVDSSYSTIKELLDYHNVTQLQQNRFLSIIQPKQRSFVSLVQWFAEEKVMPSTFNIEKYNKNHRLIPYGNNIYGVIKQENYSLYCEQGHLNTTFESERHNSALPLAIIKFNKTEYTRAKEEYRKFWEWRNGRNPIRLQMEETFAFDGKHAMHLVRLLRMAVEILRDEQVIVKRPDAEELLNIRAGNIKYDTLIKYATETDDEIRNKWYKKTKLPKKPNLKNAAEILMKTQQLVWDSK